MRRLLEFLSLNDLPLSLALQLYRRYGAGALETLKANPYMLVDEIYGVDFAVMDFSGRLPRLPSKSFPKPGGQSAPLCRTAPPDASPPSQIFRQAEASAIVRAAHAVNQGALPELRNHVIQPVRMALHHPLQFFRHVDFRLIQPSQITGAHCWRR